MIIYTNTFTKHQRFPELKKAKYKTHFISNKNVNRDKI